MVAGPGFSYKPMPPKSELGRSQTDDKSGEDRPVAYFTRKGGGGGGKAERNYATVERKCLAIVDGIRHFEVYLMWVPFILVTGHGCLQYLHNTKNSGGTPHEMVSTPPTF